MQAFFFFGFSLRAYNNLGYLLTAKKIDTNIDVEIENTMETFSDLKREGHKTELISDAPKLSLPTSINDNAPNSNGSITTIDNLPKLSTLDPIRMRHLKPAQLLMDNAIVFQLYGMRSIYFSYFFLVWLISSYILLFVTPILIFVFYQYDHM